MPLSSLELSNYPHRQNQPHRLAQIDKSVCLVKLHGAIVNGINNNHRRAYNRRIFEGLLNSLRQQHRAQTLSLSFFTNRKPADQCRAYQGITRDVPLRRLWNRSRREAVRTEGEVTGNCDWVAIWNEDEYRVRPAA